MLIINVPPQEYFNDETNTFKQFKGATLQLEHSLLSIFKWEGKYKKPFLSDGRKTNDEFKDYVKFMTINQVPSEAYKLLTRSDYKKIDSYIHDPCTATTFKTVPGASKGKKSSEIMTAELIYYYMIACEIPIDPCQKWHIDRLFTLLRICSIKNDPKGQKKMSKRDIYSQNKALNAARRAKYGTHG